ncbi:low-density lipoprotein receptor class A domain-containing protein 1-like [Ambystoma mexicanum]|uniref:low-density lipoprotein receptor class A domain-containing protein 1-like n=1 Tax=Ambystoma mexicanum TaxID=8296 RepID=UPI0037E7DA4E
MRSNRVFPHRQDRDIYSVSSAGSDSQRSLHSYHGKDARGCSQRRCLLVTGAALLVLGAVAAALALGVIFGIPAKQPMARQCRTTSNTSGFLCDDRATCIPAASLCNEKQDCSNGEDESTEYCGKLPASLPSGLVFSCANKRSWTYIDKVCDSRNDCGDCSDESVLLCPSCSGWRCNTVFFADCDCIPKARCRDNIQDCADWSDEVTC